MNLDAFPGAVPADEYLKGTAEALAPHGLVPGAALPLLALCRDELTVDLTRRVTDTWGPPFQMGSLGGMLFLGTAGLKAALSHAPTGAPQRLVAYVMPHVGLRADGTVGSVHRPGQQAPTGACGALLGFRDELAAGRPVTGLDEADPEMSLLRTRLARAMPDGAAADIAELTALARDVILDDLLRTAELVPGWRAFDVAVFSGIQIHTPDGDHVQPGRSSLRLADAGTDVALSI